MATDSANGFQHGTKKIYQPLYGCLFGYSIAAP